MLPGSRWACFLCDDPDAIIATASTTIITLKMGSAPPSDFRCEREQTDLGGMMARVLMKGFSNLLSVYPWRKHSGFLETGNDYNSISVDILIPMHKRLIKPSQDSHSINHGCVFPKCPTVACNWFSHILHLLNRKALCHGCEEFNMGSKFRFGPLDKLCNFSEP